MYQIQSKFKYDLQPKFKTDQFYTGGKVFLTYKEAQETKKKLSLMNDSSIFKVIKLDK